MREIGSEFWNVTTTNDSSHFFPESMQWFLSGRSALQAIIKDLRGCHCVAMPSLCCDSMITPFLKEHIDVRFYPVYWKDGLIQEIRLDCDALFLIDYFGYTGLKTELKGYSGVTIRDVTHSLFSHSYADADYYFGSLRKWCGVWTGGYAWTRNGYALPMENADDFGYMILREMAMQQKSRYLSGASDTNGNKLTDKRYLKLFAEAEQCLEHVGIAPASERDIELAGRLDVKAIRASRRSNAEILRAAFPEWLVFPKMKATDCPMFVPILVPDGRRDALRRFLIEHEIYCPVHWPLSEYHRLVEREKRLYDNELSLVCDQRYEAKDMERMVRTINLFMGAYNC